MAPSKDSCACSQEPKTQKSQTRHLDHLIDIQEGNPFTAVPRQLMDAFIDKRINETKFRLISVMLSHSANFKIKRKYLEKRFATKSLSRYLKEIIAEGYIRVEKVPLEGGGFSNVYHTNRRHLWNLDVLVDDPLPGEECPGEECPGADLNKNKDNENKPNQMNDDSNTRLGVVDAPKENHHPLVKVDPHIVETAIKIHDKFPDKLEFYDYKKVNAYLAKMVEKDGRDELDTFTAWVDVGIYKIFRVRGIRLPSFNLKVLMAMLSYWKESEDREAWIAGKELHGKLL